MATEIEKKLAAALQKYEDAWDYFVDVDMLVTKTEEEKEAQNKKFLLAKLRLINASENAHEALKEYNYNNENSKTEKEIQVIHNKV